MGPPQRAIAYGLIQTGHDSTLTGHSGREQTYLVVSRAYFWLNMSKDLRRFIRNCDACGRAKTWKKPKTGLLKPLPIPERPWQHIKLDFITDLPSSNGCTVILVLTDWLTKRSYS